MILCTSFRSNKLGWDRRYLRLIENNLCLFENAEEKDQDKALMKLDFSPDVAKIAVKSAVSATELNYAATSDLPYVLKLEYFPHTTCWPQRYRIKARYTNHSFVPICMLIFFCFNFVVREFTKCL